MAKGKMEKGIKDVKKGVNKMFDEAKEGANKAAEYVKDKAPDTFK